MISNFVKISLQNPSKGVINKIIQSRKSIVLNYPCSNKHICTPYILDLSPGVYKFECWGSKGDTRATPGLGSYTSGTLFIAKLKRFFVYIGVTGFFNAVKELQDWKGYGSLPGGATDVRLNYSENWWDNSSLISRIMVAAGGGGPDGSDSGGSGGKLVGHHSQQGYGQGGNQTHGGQGTDQGMFGKGGGHISSGIYGNGGGGSGYYGGGSSSDPYDKGGGGGSSFISGHPGCNAIDISYTESNPKHTGQPIHFSGLRFIDTVMFSGEEEMPSPNGGTEIGHGLDGAIRISSLGDSFLCTSQSIVHSLSFCYILLFIFTS